MLFIIYKLSNLLNKSFIILGGLVHISKTEGISSLWSSTLPSLILVSNPAIQFMTYEAIKRKVNTYHGTKDLGSVAYFLMGALSKAIATGITYPLQLIQNKQRVCMIFFFIFKKTIFN